MKNIFFLLSISVILFVLVFTSCTTSTDPDRCSLCALAPCNAPYLVDLNTGESGVIEVFKTNPALGIESADTQDGGAFSLVNIAGLEGYRDTGICEIHVFISKKFDSFNTKLFCRSCRKQIHQYKNEGYIIVDKYGSEYPVIYSIDANEQYNFRCYQVSVIKSVNGEFEIIVKGCSD